MSSRSLILRCLSRHQGRYLAGFLALLGASFVVMLPPLVLRYAIDDIDEAVNGSADLSLNTLAGYGAIIIALAVVESVFRFGARVLVSGTSRKVEYELRADLAEHQLRLDQSFFKRNSTGDLMARATNDLQMVRDLLGPTFIDLIRIFTMLTVGFAFLLTVNLRLALLAYAYFPVVALLIICFAAVVEERYRRVQSQFGSLSTRVQENISGMRTIKAYAREESETANFAAANQEMMKRSMAWAYYTAALWPMMVLATGASTVLILWFGGKDVVDGRITAGQFVQFNTYLVILSSPLMSLGWTVSAFQQGTASFKRIAEVLSTTPAIAEPDRPASPAALTGAIRFEGVGFSYDTRDFVLKDINLDIPAGTTIAIVGTTGSGKTPLVSLLPRLFDPTEGRVLVDGIDVRDLSLQQLRQSVAFVPQETFLFSDPLRENVAYGRLDATDDQLDYAVQTSQLVNDLAQLTNGLATVIGERGVTLSGGQKQRAALARAVIKDSPILILDDALSHVDTHTEEEILRRLREFMATRTTILVAHRTSTVASADRIVVLEGGTIAENGTHAELLTRGGLYSRFYRRQLLSEQVEGDEVGAEEAAV